MNQPDSEILLQHPVVPAEIVRRAGIPDFTFIKAVGLVNVTAKPMGAFSRSMKPFKSPIISTLLFCPPLIETTVSAHSPRATSEFCKHNFAVFVRESTVALEPWNAP